MFEWRRNPTTVSECCLILVICLGIPIISSLSSMAHRNEMTTFPMTDGRLVSMMIIQLLSLSAAGFILHMKGWRHEDLGTQISLKQLRSGFLLFAISYGTFIFIYIITTKILGLPKGWGTLPVIAEFSIPIAIFFSALNALFEESVTVGYLLNAIHHHGQIFAISFSMFLRFLYHTYQGPIAVISIMPMGILFAFVYWRWHRLWPLVFAHFLMDLFAFLAMKFSIMGNLVS